SAAEIKSSLGAASGKGAIAISRGESDFTYDIQVDDAARLKEFLPVPAKGKTTFHGRAVGPVEQTRVDGTFNASDVDMAGGSALTASGNYHGLGSAARIAEATGGRG